MSRSSGHAQPWGCIVNLSRWPSHIPQVATEETHPTVKTRRGWGQGEASVTGDTDGKGVCGTPDSVARGPGEFPGRREEAVNRSTSPEKSPGVGSRGTRLHPMGPAEQDTPLLPDLIAWAVKQAHYVYPAMGNCRPNLCSGLSTQWDQ